MDIKSIYLRNLFDAKCCKRILKQSQNKKGRKFVSAAPKMVPFLQLAAEKKTPILVQLKQIFGLSDYDRALVRCLKLRHTIVRLSYGRNLNGLGFKL